MKLLLKLSVAIGLTFAVSSANSFSYGMYSNVMPEPIIENFCDAHSCVNQVFRYSTTDGLTANSTINYYVVYYYHTRQIESWELCRYEDDPICHPQGDGDGDEGGFGGKG